MVKDPLGEWDRVYTFCALLVDLGQYDMIFCAFCFSFGMKKFNHHLYTGSQQQNNLSVIGNWPAQFHTTLAPSLTFVSHVARTSPSRRHANYNRCIWRSCTIAHGKMPPHEPHKASPCICTPHPILTFDDNYAHLVAIMVKIQHHP